MRPSVPPPVRAGAALARRLAPAFLSLLALLAVTAPARAATVPDAGPDDAAASRATTPSPAAPRVAARPPDVILVSFDTTRRDHLSCYGHDRLTTPRVDALAAAGTRFTDCQAVVPLTGPSHVTMMTGLPPHVHGAFRNGVPLPEGPTTVAEVFTAAGYRTGAVVSGWTLKRRQCGLDRGFATYDDEGLDERYSVVNLMRRADAVTDAALAWAAPLAAQGDERPPYFLFVHYFDPHEPYDAPADVAAPGPNPAADGGPELAKNTRKLAEYDREIAFSDRELGRLLDGLRERGLLDNAITVFTADHGQSFGEHGYGGQDGAHGRHVYQSCVAVPLVVSWPGHLAEGATSDLPVSHLDILATVTDLAGVPLELVPLGHQGASLASVLRDPKAPAPWGGARRVRHSLTFRGAVGNKWNIFRWMQNKDVDGATPLEVATVVDGTKVLFDPRNKHRYEVFDLAADPGELKPVADPDGKWRSTVASTWAWYESTRIDFKDVQPTDEELEALRALGYVE